MKAVVSVLLALSTALASQVDHSGHAHSSTAGASPFEWGAVFAVDGHNLTFTASSIAHMKIVLMQSSAGTNDAMHTLVDSGEVGHSFAATCTEVEAGGALTYNEDSCYEIHVDGAANAAFTIYGLAVGHLAIFTEHGVSEFEGSTHYLMEGTEDVEPAATFVADATPTVTFTLTCSGAVSDYTAAVQTQLKAVVATQANVHVADVALAVTAGSVNLAFTITTANAAAQANVTSSITTAFSSATAATTLFSTVTGVTVSVSIVSIGGGGGAGADKPWGEAIGSAILVNLCTLFGVVLTIPVLRSCSQNHPDAFGAVTSAFAAGAILACAFYLILLEASHMTGGDTEGQMAAIWGSLVMGGFLLATALDTLVSIFIGSAKISTTANTKDGEGTDIVNVLSMGHRTRLLCGILVGDFLHNLCDGFFIGAAFLGCGSSMGWSVTAATIYHELAQEIADYVVLTDPKRGALKPVIALTINFISGTSVVFGTLIILAQDSISHTTIGYILAFSGGVYIQIGATECMSRVNELTTTKSLKLAALAAFVIGATAIALVLFDHQHCTVSVSSATGSATAAADPHAGHGH